MQRRRLQMWQSNLVLYCELFVYFAGILRKALESFNCSSAGKIVEGLTQTSG